jgi:hypothetical protein
MRRRCPRTTSHWHTGRVPGLCARKLFLRDSFGRYSHLLDSKILVDKAPVASSLPADIWTLLDMECTWSKQRMQSTIL